MSTQTPSLDKSPTEAADEFNAALEDLLSQLDTKFRSVSTDILVKREFVLLREKEDDMKCNDIRERTLT